MLTIKEAALWIAEKLKRKYFSQATIRSWILAGKLKAELVGGKNYVEEKDLEIFLPEKMRNNSSCFDQIK